MAPKILIIGATGFVGSSLLEKLEQQHIPVRVMARTPEKVISSSELTEIVYGDLDKKETLEGTLAGIEVIYYLAHAMNSSNDNFIDKEKKQAQNLVEFLNKKQRIIYLGGIIPQVELSEHLESRKLVGDILRSSESQIVEFRASIIIGKGSASFEMVRSLVERLPIIVSASWSRSKCQPIALFDVIRYLELASTIELMEKNNIFNIGGKEIINYEDLLLRYAKFKNLIRPHLMWDSMPKNLASELLEYIVPEHSDVGKKLLESIEHPTIVLDQRAIDTFGLSCFDLDNSFYLAKDEPLSELSLDEFTNILKNGELPQFVVGQAIQLYLPLSKVENINTFMSQKIIDLKGILPNKYSFNMKNESFSIPQVGEFKIFKIEQRVGLFIAIKPKYSFQSLGWVILKQILSRLPK